MATLEIPDELYEELHRIAEEIGLPVRELVLQHVRQLVQKHNVQELLTQLEKLRAEESPSALEREAANLIQAMRMERESELLAALEHKLALLTSRSSHSVSSVSRSSTAGQEQSAALG
ncbi:MAG: hypothetical protein N2545_01955 [Thermoflexales bacterium]|nr:hypothetical protein [Thermoflexales bacterium]